MTENNATLASENLPKDPLGALSEMVSVLKDSRDFGEPHYAARAALTIINELSMKGGLDNSNQMNEAVYWLSMQGIDGLGKIEAGTRRASNIAPAELAARLWASPRGVAALQQRLTPHCCRHGFATSMLHPGFDVKTVAERGGWKDAATVLRTYAHAIRDQTVTYALFDTPVTQGSDATDATIGNLWRKQQ